MKLSLTLLFLAASAAAFAPLQHPSGSSRSTVSTRSLTHRLAAVDPKSLSGAQEMIDAIIDEKNCNPFFVRLAWHDSGTYDVNLKDKEWPAAGGAIGSIRFEPEIKHGANNGLSNAVTLLEPVKKKFPDLSYADIYQMASARGIEKAGGPKIDMKYVLATCSAITQLSGDIETLCARGFLSLLRCCCWLAQYRSVSLYFPSLMTFSIALFYLVSLS